MMRTIAVQSSQTLWDIAVQYCGAAEAALEVATLNNLLPTSQPGTGVTLNVPKMENKKVVKHYADHGLVPATKT